MKYKLGFITLMILSCLATKAQEKTDFEKLYNVIEVFKTAFVDSTKEQQFYDLFLHDSITWASVYEGKTKEHLKNKDNYQSSFSSTFKNFYTWIKKDGNYKESFYNIIINKENNHATISFDYTFEKKGDIQNWGKEYWTLLKVEEDWKIASVLWTMNYQNIEQCPFTNNSYYRE
ncbi:hypothetical protein [Abyssalbus ytuae]|uniref:SnoaL-like domain-containing protein n=1 Tax=Abyssalbus ytuae TaxID=2926907 RepID=A0A9E6ZSQ0_9FLAO|nr:hypothetical protein [Abyssalbus ytuae]UOB18153.1 hypothetical protein MQE35_02360 [Abyssalbus ytuae]